MYLVEIEFKILENKKIEDQEELIEILHSAWSTNGQIVGTQYQYAQTKNSYKMYQLIPEKDALTNKYNNNYAKENIQKLKEVGLDNPTITTIDDSPQENDLCQCEQKSEYILYTTYTSLSPALRCKKCFKTIPLYHLPKLDEFSDNYYPLITWESDYQACDALQMNCSVGVNFAYKQLGSIDSQLSKDGLEICKNIEKLTGIRTYYYLYKYTAKSRKQELLRKCPSCQGEWLLDTPLHNQFDFECKKCGLLSNIGWDKR